MHNSDLPFRTATLRDPPYRFPIRTDCSHMALVYQSNWALQHLPLEPACLPSTISLLHVQVFEKDSEKWVDVLRWNSAMYNRYIFYTKLCCLSPFGVLSVRSFGFPNFLPF